MIGKSILVGITYDIDGKIRREQHYGTITRIQNGTLTFKEPDGKEFTVMDKIEAADPENIYTLKSTGEKVSGIDYTCCFYVTKNNGRRK